MTDFERGKIAGFKEAIDIALSHVELDGFRVKAGPVSDTAKAIVKDLSRNMAEIVTKLDAEQTKGKQHG